MTTPRQLPYLVELAWGCLDYHRHSCCWMCTESGFCPMKEAARNRIREWRRYRAVWGYR